MSLEPADQEQEQDGRTQDHTVLDPRALSTAQYIGDRDSQDSDEHPGPVVAHGPEHTHAAPFTLALGAYHHDGGEWGGDHGVDHGSQQQIGDQGIRHLYAAGRARRKHEHHRHDGRRRDCQGDDPAVILFVAASGVVDNIAEDHVSECVHHLGNGHHHAHRANGHPHLVCVEVVHLAHQIRHDAQGQLAAHIRQIVPRSHRAYRAVLVITHSLFLFRHVFFLPVCFVGACPRVVSLLYCFLRF